MKRDLEWLGAQVGAPLLAAGVGMTAAIAATKTPRGPANYYYAFHEMPLPYRIAMLAGAAGLGICVLFLLARLLQGTSAMSVDTEPLPWWARSKAAIPIAVTSAALCTVAQFFKTPL